MHPSLRCCSAGARIPLIKFLGKRSFPSSESYVLNYSPNSRLNSPRRASRASGCTLGAQTTIFRLPGKNELLWLITVDPASFKKQTVEWECVQRVLGSTTEILEAENPTPRGS
jgi:hypothetical protein